MAAEAKAVPWAADKVERWDISRLTPYASNPRLHSPEQVAQICRSIQEFGWTVPVLVDETGTLIAGHGRVMAAQQLGLTSIPVMTAAGWSDAQKRAYVIADNQLTLNASWDLPLLRQELGELANMDYDLSLTGFDEVNLATFMGGTDGESDPEEVPEPPDDPVTKTGDLWLLGKHRLLCGDSTAKADVEQLLAGAKPHLMVTDPPYGVEYDPDWRNRADRANGRPDGARAIGLVKNDERADWSAAWQLFPGDVIYSWHPPGARSVEHFGALVSSGFDVRMQIIWAKQQFPIGRGNYHVQHEPCWYAVRKGKTAHWQGDRTQSTLWSIDKPVKSETGHSTQKPVECMKRPIENNSKAGESIYDPFVGSGTTIIAAEMTARRCFALDLDPTYVDVCVARWEKFTGERAILDGTKRTFEHIAKDRGKSPKSTPAAAPAAPPP